MSERRRFVAPATIAVTASLVFAGVAWAGRDARSQHSPIIELSAAAHHELAQQRPSTSAPAGPRLTVEVPAGPLVLLDAPDHVAVRRIGDTHRFRGVVRGVQVVDTRSSKRGWQLLVAPAVDSRRTSELAVGVTHVVATARSTHGLSAAGRTRLSSVRATAVASATPAVGNGSFAVTLVVDAVLPAVRSASAQLPLTFSVR